MAIDYCLNNDIMTDYLTDNESEVINMFGFEYNKDEERKSLIELGEERGTISIIKNLMENKCWSAEEAMAAMGIENSEYPRYLALLYN